MLETSICNSPRKSTDGYPSLTPERSYPYVTQRPKPRHYIDSKHFFIDSPINALREVETEELVEINEVGTPVGKVICDTGARPNVERPHIPYQLKVTQRPLLLTPIGHNTNQTKSQTRSAVEEPKVVKNVVPYHANGIRNRILLTPVGYKIGNKKVYQNSKPVGQRPDFSHLYGKNMGLTNQKPNLKDVCDAYIYGTLKTSIVDNKTWDCRVGGVKPSPVQNQGHTQGHQNRQRINQPIGQPINNIYINLRLKLLSPKNMMKQSGT